MDNGASSYRRFLEGDDDGIVQIIKEHKDGLMLYLNSFVANIHLAEDLTEDTFVKLIANRPRFSGKSTFKTWLYAIGRNVALDFLRKNAKLPTVSESSGPIHLLSIADRPLWGTANPAIAAALLSEISLMPKLLSVMKTARFKVFTFVGRLWINSI